LFEFYLSFVLDWAAMSEERPKESKIKYFSELERSMIEFMIFDHNESSATAFSEMADELGVEKDQIQAILTRLEAIANASRTAAITRAVKFAVMSEEIDNLRIPPIRRGEFNLKENQLIEAFNSGWTNSEIGRNLQINQDEFFRLRSAVFGKMDTKSRFMVVAALAKAERLNG